jgi:hypothetical protein
MNQVMATLRLMRAGWVLAREGVIAGLPAKGLDRHGGDRHGLRRRWREGAARS